MIYYATLKMIPSASSSSMKSSNSSFPGGASARTKVIVINSSGVPLSGDPVLSAAAPSAATPQPLASSLPVSQPLAPSLPVSQPPVSQPPISQHTRKNRTRKDRTHQATQATIVVSSITPPTQVSLNIPFPEASTASSTPIQIDAPVSAFPPTATNPVQVLTAAPQATSHADFPIAVSEPASPVPAATVSITEKTAFLVHVFADQIPEFHSYLSDSSKEHVEQKVRNFVQTPDGNKFAGAFNQNTRFITALLKHLQEYLEPYPAVVFMESCVNIIANRDTICNTDSSEVHTIAAPLLLTLDRYAQQRDAQAEDLFILLDPFISVYVLLVQEYEISLQHAVVIATGYHEHSVSLYTEVEIEVPDEMVPPHINMGFNHTVGDVIAAFKGGDRSPLNTLIHQWLTYILMQKFTPQGLDENSEQWNQNIGRFSAFQEWLAKEEQFGDYHCTNLEGLALVYNIRPCDEATTLLKDGFIPLPRLFAVSDMLDLFGAKKEDIVQTVIQMVNKMMADAESQVLKVQQMMLCMLQRDKTNCVDPSMFLRMALFEFFLWHITCVSKDRFDACFSLQIQRHVHVEGTCTNARGKKCVVGKFVADVNDAVKKFVLELYPEKEQQFKNAHSARKQRQQEKFQPKPKPKQPIAHVPKGAQMLILSFDNSKNSALTLSHRKQTEFPLSKQTAFRLTVSSAKQPTQQSTQQPKQQPKQQPEKPIQLTVSSAAQSTVQPKSATRPKGMDRKVSKNANARDDRDRLLAQAEAEARKASIAQEGSSMDPAFEDDDFFGFGIQNSSITEPLTSLQQLESAQRVTTGDILFERDDTHEMKTGNDSGDESDDSIDSLGNLLYPNTAAPNKCGDPLEDHHVTGGSVPLPQRQQPWSNQQFPAAAVATRPSAATSAPQPLRAGYQQSTASTSQPLRAGIQPATSVPHTQQPRMGYQQFPATASTGQPSTAAALSPFPVSTVQQQCVQPGYGPARIAKPSTAGASQPSAASSAQQQRVQRGYEFARQQSLTPEENTAKWMSRAPRRG